MMKFSKALRHGHAVAIRGDKYIRAGANVKRIVGVYTLPKHYTVLVESGMKMDIYHPAGIVITGEHELLVGRAK